MEKLNIKVPLANRLYPMSVDVSEEKVIRISASKIEKMLKGFKEKYSVRDDQVLLAMCALQLCVKIEKIESLPLIISDDIESVTQTSKMIKILEDLNLSQDVQRLENRKKRSGKVALRGRTKKTGKSVLFVLSDSKNVKKACNSIPGVDACSVNDLSVLDLAPGANLIRLTAYSKKAIAEISKIKSRHLELMVTMN